MWGVWRATGVSSGTALPGPLQDPGCAIPAAYSCGQSHRSGAWIDIVNASKQKVRPQPRVEYGVARAKWPPTLAKAQSIFSVLGFCQSDKGVQE